MKDPFGTMGNQIVLTAASDEPSVSKKEKKVDMVKIYLASVPSLESAKNALEEIENSVQDEEVKKSLNGYISSILKITESILDLTKVAIKGVREDASNPTVVPEGKKPAITPEMISGNALSLE